MFLQVCKRMVCTGYRGQQALPQAIFSFIHLISSTFPMFFHPYSTPDSNSKQLGVFYRIPCNTTGVSYRIYKRPLKSLGKVVELKNGDGSLFLVIKQAIDLTIPQPTPSMTMSPLHPSKKSSQKIKDKIEKKTWKTCMPQYHSLPHPPLIPIPNQPQKQRRDAKV